MALPKDLFRIVAGLIITQPLALDELDFLAAYHNLGTHHGDDDSMFLKVLQLGASMQQETA